MSVVNSTHRNNRSLALSLVAIVAGMVMLSFATVPLYRLFCQVTGFGGTTQRAEATGAPVEILDREMNVFFTGTTDPALSWEFRPLVPDISLRIGENTLVAYEATNLSDKPLTGMATFNVTPHKAGQYFVKLECFCYDEKTIGPGERVTLPVSFYIDPAIAEDSDLDDVTHLSLSYTFFARE